MRLADDWQVERKRVKRKRWGDANDNKAAGLMGLPTSIFADMTTEQLDAFALHLRIEEISQKLRINDVVPADGDRYVMFVPAHCLHKTQFAVSPASIRQPRSPCQHARVPLPQAPRG